MGKEKDSGERQRKEGSKGGKESKRKDSALIYLKNI